MWFGLQETAFCRLITLFALAKEGLARHSKRENHWRETIPWKLPRPGRPLQPGVAARIEPWSWLYVSDEALTCSALGSIVAVRWQTVN